MGSPGRPPRKRSRDETKDGGVHLEPHRHKAPDVRDMPVLTRDEARDRRWRFFYTGLRCKNGHLSVRRVDTGGCVECNRERALKAKAKKRKAAGDQLPDMSDLW